MDVGAILFFKQNGQSTKHYPLCVGETSFGSSLDADVRFRIEDTNLEPIHCILDAKENGLVQLINKSKTKPVKVNGKPVLKVKLLYHKDMIEVPGKCFQYLNENINKDAFDKAEKELKNIDITYVQRGVTPIKKVQTPKLSVYGRVRTPEARKSGVKRPTFSTPKPKTPSTSLNRSKLLADKAKTTSKVILTKAKKSPTSLRKKRRLSLGDNLGKLTEESPRISARNILLSAKVCQSIATPASKASTSKVTNQKTPKKAELTPRKKLIDNNNSAITPQNKRLDELKQSTSKTPLRNSPKYATLASLKSPEMVSTVNSPDSPLVKEFTKTPVPITPSKRVRPKKSIGTPANVELLASPLTPSKKGRPKKSVRTPGQVVSPGEFSKSPVTPSKRGRPRKSITSPVIKVSPVAPGRGRPKKSVGTPAKLNTPARSTPLPQVGRPKKSVSTPLTVVESGDTLLASPAKSVERSETAVEFEPAIVTPSKRGRAAKKSVSTPAFKGADVGSPLRSPLMSPGRKSLKKSIGKVAEAGDLTEATPGSLGKNSFYENKGNYNHGEVNINQSDESFTESKQVQRKSSRKSALKPAEQDSENTETATDELSVSQYSTQLDVLNNRSRYSRKAALKLHEITDTGKESVPDERLEVSKRSGSRKRTAASVSRVSLLAVDHDNEELEVSEESLASEIVFEHSSNVNKSPNKRQSRLEKSLNTSSKSLKAGEGNSLVNLEEELNDDQEEETLAKSRRSRSQKSLNSFSESLKVRNSFINSERQGKTRRSRRSQVRSASGDTDEVFELPLNNSQEEESQDKTRRSRRSQVLSASRDADEIFELPLNNSQEEKSRDKTRRSRRSQSASRDADEIFELPLNNSQEEESQDKTRRSRRSQVLSVSRDADEVFELPLNNSQEEESQDKTRRSSRIQVPSASGNADEVFELPLDFSRKSRSLRKSKINPTQFEKSLVNVSPQRKLSVGRKISPNKSLKFESSVTEAFDKTRPDALEISPVDTLQPRKSSVGRKSSSKGTRSDEAQISPVKTLQPRKSSVGQESSLKELSTVTSDVNETDISLPDTTQHRRSSVRRSMVFNKSKIDATLPDEHQIEDAQESVINSSQRQSVGRMSRRSVAINKSMNIDVILDEDPTEDGEKSVINSSQRESSGRRKSSQNKSIKALENSETGSIANASPLRKSLKVAGTEEISSLDETVESQVIVSNKRKSSVRHKSSPNNSLSHISTEEYPVHVAHQKRFSIRRTFTPNTSIEVGSNVEINQTDSDNLENAGEVRESSRSSRRSRSGANFSRLSKDFIVEIPKASTRKSSIYDAPAMEKSLNTSSSSRSFTVLSKHLDHDYSRYSTTKTKSLLCSSSSSSKLSEDYAFELSDVSSKRSRSQESTSKSHESLNKSLRASGSQRNVSDNRLSKSQSSIINTSENTDRDDISNDFLIYKNKSSFDPYEFVSSPLEPSSTRKSSKKSIGEVIASTSMMPGSPLRLTGRKSYSKSKSLSAIPSRMVPKTSERRSFRVTNNSLQNEEFKKPIDSYSTIPDDSVELSSISKMPSEVFIISSSLENSSRSMGESDMSSRRSSRTTARSQIFQENISSSSTPYAKSKNSTALQSISDNNSSADESTDDELGPISPLKAGSTRKSSRSFKEYASNTSKRSLTYSTAQSDDFSRSSDVIYLSSADDKENSLPSTRHLGSVSNSMQYEVKTERRSTRRVNTSTEEREISNTEQKRSSLRRNSATGAMELTEETVRKSVTRRSTRLTIDPNDSSKRKVSIADVPISSYKEDSEAPHDDSVLSIEGTPEINGENVYEKEVIKSPKRSFLRKSFINHDVSNTSSVKSRTPTPRVSSRRSSHVEDDVLVSETPILTKTPARKSNISMVEPTSSAKLKTPSPRKSIRVQTPKEIVKVTSTGTPKSAVKPSRRTKSSFYNPLTEEVTPVTTPVGNRSVGSDKDVSMHTPVNKIVSEKDGEFKTPINTPGLFESIIHSVIRSRKRGRESNGSVMKSSKRLKLNHSVSRDELDESHLSITSEVEVQQVVIHPIKSPKNDLTDVRGVKKLLATPKELKSPKNDLTRLPNLRNVFSPPTHKSPLNDLTDIRGIKKILKTPKVTKSPRNSLSNVQGVKKLLGTPPANKSPKNDLTDVRGVKKLLGTPDVAKSPKNDLTRVPNLRRMMSPKAQKSPRNDLTNVPNLRRIMSPKTQKQPENNLNDVSGVASMFNVSGVESLYQETSDELFDIVAGRPSLKTYRHTSLSPKKALTSLDVIKKVVEEDHVTSPRIEKWVEDQTAMMVQENEEKKDTVEKKTRGRKPTKRIMSEADLDAGLSPVVPESPGKSLRSRREAAVEGEENVVQKTTRARKKTLEKQEVKTKKTRGGAGKIHETTDTSADSDDVVVKPARSKRGGKVEPAEGKNNAVKSKNDDMAEVPKKVTRGRRNRAQDIENSPALRQTVKNVTAEIEEDSQGDAEELPRKAIRGRRKMLQEPEQNVGDESPLTLKETEKSDLEETPLEKENTSGRSKRGQPTKNEEEFATKKITRGRRKIDSTQDVAKETAELEEKPLTQSKGQPKNLDIQESDKVVTKTTRAKRGQKKTEDVIVLEDCVIENSVIKKSPSKKSTRTRGGQKEVEDSVEVVSSPPKKSTRARGKAKEVKGSVEIVSSPPKKSTRSRGGPKEVEDPFEVVSSPPKKSTRARGEPKEAEDPVKVVSSPPKKTARARRGQKKEELVDDTDTTKDAPKENNVQKKAVKASGKRNAVKDDIPAKEEEKVENEGSTNGRKKVVEEDSINSPKPKRVRRGVAAPKDSEDDSTSEKKTLPKRANKRNAIQDLILDSVEVDSPRSLRSKRGHNNKYNDSDYETTPIKNAKAKKVTFQDGSASLEKKTVETRTSKRTRKL